MPNLPWSSHFHHNRYRPFLCESDTSDFHYSPLPVLHCTSRSRCFFYRCMRTVAESAQGTPFRPFRQFSPGLTDPQANPTQENPALQPMRFYSWDIHPDKRRIRITMYPFDPLSGLQEAQRRNRIAGRCTFLYPLQRDQITHPWDRHQCIFCNFPGTPELARPDRRIQIPHLKSRHLSKPMTHTLYKENYSCRIIPDLL